MEYIRVVQEFTVSYVKPADKMLNVDYTILFFTNWYKGQLELPTLIEYLLNYMNYTYEQTQDGWSNLKLEFS